MEFFVEILIVCLTLFLYWVFILGKDDFILLRKNVTLEHLFNLTFLTLIIGLIFARIFYVFENLSPRFLQPLVLFLFPYFPGLSLSGAIIGSISFIAFRTQRRRVPFGRIFDIFSVAFSFVYPIGYVLVSLVSLILTKKFYYQFPIGFIAFALLFIFSFWLFAKNRYQDGSIGFISLCLFSLINMALYVFPKNFTPTFSVEAALFTIMAIGFFGLFLTNEKLLRRGKKR